MVLMVLMVLTVLTVLGVLTGPAVLLGFLGARSFFTIGVDGRCGARGFAASPRGGFVETSGAAGGSADGGAGGTLGFGGATGFGGMDALPGLTSLGCPDAAGGGGA
jgi:hypothetical protein